MKSEREKREEEVERLLRGETLTSASNLAFQEELRKAASAIIQENAGSTQNIERGAGHSRTKLGPRAAGLGLLLLGAALSFSAPLLAAALIISGTSVMLWPLYKRRNR